jgi:hypothetical protein
MHAVPSPPENVIRISHNETLFEIQWSPVADLQLSHYTVFWCRSHVRDSIKPVECLGELYSQEIPAIQETLLNVTVQTTNDGNYEFAVAANKGNHSSGMVWSTLFTLADMRQVVVNVAPQNSSSLQVSWSAESCYSLGRIIIGFNIYYCPAVTMLDNDFSSSKCLSESFQLLIIHTKFFS